jgi:hypothetical protein
LPTSSAKPTGNAARFFNHSPVAARRRRNPKEQMVSSDLDRQRRAKEGLQARHVGDAPLSWRRGTVVAVGATGPNTIDVSFDDDGPLTPPWTSVRYLGSYKPKRGDVVEVLDFGTELLVLGKRA